MADVLELVGIPYLTCITQSGGKHVEFVSIDKCKVIMLNILFLNKIVISLFSFLLLHFFIRYIYVGVKFPWLSNIFMILGGKWRSL